MFKTFNQELFDVNAARNQNYKSPNLNSTDIWQVEFNVKENLRPVYQDKPLKKVSSIARLYIDANSLHDKNNPSADLLEVTEDNLNEISYDLLSKVETYATSNKFIQLCNIYSNSMEDNEDERDIYIVAIPTRGLVGHVCIPDEAKSYISVKNYRYMKTILYDLNDMKNFTGILYIVLKVDFNDKVNYHYEIPIIQYFSKTNKKRVTKLILDFNKEPCLEVNDTFFPLDEGEEIPDITNTNLCQVEIDKDRDSRHQTQFSKAFENAKSVPKIISRSKNNSINK